MVPRWHAGLARPRFNDRQVARVEIFNNGRNDLTMLVTSEELMLPGCLIDGKSGHLEATLDRSPRANSEYIAVCCHPHPQHGGAMGNKVVYTASRTLAALGILSFRFNFRGVGKSDGEYDKGVGEQDDLRSVVNWVLQQYPNRQLILAGFSFGSRIAAMQAADLNACLLLSIAPPIGRIDFTDFNRPDCPWLIIQGDDDELVAADEVEEWAKTFEHQPELVKMPSTSHFFHGKLTELRSAVEHFAHTHLVL